MSTNFMKLEIGKCEMINNITCYLNKQNIYYAPNLIIHLWNSLNGIVCHLTELIYLVLL